MKIMRFYKHDVERLAQLLSSSDATQRIDMKLSELDGYLTAVFLCPEFIPPSSWLTDLFRGKVPEEFPRGKVADLVVENIVGHLEYIADRAKTRQRLQPIFSNVEDTDQVSWQPWVQGFNRGVALRKDVWEALFDHSDEITRSALSLFLVLYEIAEGKSDFDDQLIRAFSEEALDLIPNALIELLQQARADLFEEPTSRQKRQIKKPKRNDPCRCGSEYLYKQCCGKN